MSKDVSHSLSHFLAHTRTTISTLELFFPVFGALEFAAKTLRAPEVSKLSKETKKPFPGMEETETETKILADQILDIFWQK